MAKTSQGLVAHCEKALKEKWYYLWGSYAQIATKTIIDNNIKQYPENAKWRTYVTGAIGKTRVCDCYGLVKSYLWWTNDTSHPQYKGSQDRNTSSAYNAAKEKGDLSKMPEIPGLILYMPGHVGVYVGNGRFIECAGGGVGMREGRINNGVVTSGSRFTKWFKDTHIEYTPIAPVSVVDQLFNKGFITDKAYWNSILNGEKTANPAYLKTLLERVVK